MTDATSTVQTYLAMWNETDAATRSALIEQAWTPDGRYTDPVLEARGYGELAQMVAGVHEKFPGHKFRGTSGLDQHHDSVRFAWELVAPDGAVTVAGIDVGILAEDGRLRQITGFFGELAKAA
jgi:hypothetical protein